MQREQASLEALVHSNELRILHRDLSLVVDVVVNAIAPVCRPVLWLLRAAACGRSA